MKEQFTLLSFNLLSPCYFRYAKCLEATYHEHYLLRLSKLLYPMKQEKCDILCLQEYWFQSEAYQRYFYQTFHRTHELYAVKRPGTKEDGIAVLVNRQKFHVVDFQHYSIDNYSDRVTSFLRLELKTDRFKHQLFVENERNNHRRRDQKNVRSPLSFLLVNCHLSFPHNTSNRYLRIFQVSRILELIQQYQQQHQIEYLPVIFCGDFNDYQDLVYHQVLNFGFESVYKAVNGKEAKVTHCTHKSEQKCVDYIFLAYFLLQNNCKVIPTPPFNYNHQSIIQPTSCFLYPKDLSSEVALKRPKFDPYDYHRHHNYLENYFVGNTDQLIDKWRTVSDHRPVIAEFDVEF